jgi:hypothetical protein
MLGDIPIPADRWNGGTATESGSREANELIVRNKANCRMPRRAKQSQSAERAWQAEGWRRLHG